MNLVLLGPPASGKGTCSQYLVNKYNFYHISMGDLLREFTKSDSPLASLVKETIDNGLILEETLTSQILYDYLSKHNLFDNILLDGYPRGLKSVDCLSQFLDIDRVLVLDANIDIIKDRIANRLVCSSCGKIFNKRYYHDYKCNNCGAELVVRRDDNFEVLNTRISEYQRVTLPVINYYRERNLTFDINTENDYKKQIDTFMENWK